MQVCDKDIEFYSTMNEKSTIESVQWLHLWNASYFLGFLVSVFLWRFLYLVYICNNLLYDCHFWAFAAFLILVYTHHEYVWLTCWIFITLNQLLPLLVEGWRVMQLRACLMVNKNLKVDRRLLTCVQWFRATSYITGRVYAMFDLRRVTDYF